MDSRCLNMLSLLDEKLDMLTQAITVMFVSGLCDAGMYSKSAFQLCLNHVDN